MNGLTGDIIYSRDEEIRHLLTKWANYEDGDLCHDATEILEPLCKLFEVPIQRKLNITRQKFEEGCCQYQNKLFGLKPIRFSEVFADE